MKLYDLPRHSYFTIENGSLLNAEEPEVFYFDHIDGMYSFCLNKDNGVVHFAAWTPVQPSDKWKKDETKTSI